MNINRSVLAATLAMVVGSSGVAGCKKHKTSSAEDQTQESPATSQPAAPAATQDPTPAPSAKGEDVNMTPQPVPPADQAETQPAAPSPKHTWVKGYWHWANNAYAWHAGYWSDPEVAVNVAPPALRVEHVGPAPGAGYFYAPGYWRWGGTSYLWAPGHYALRRDGWAYAHPHYEVVGGRYYQRGFGWERRDAGWDRRYHGWEHRGDVWVHRGYAREWDHRVQHESWGRSHGRR